MYAKLFASLYQGTLRGCADEILVFTNLLAFADSMGIVDKHFRSIADETGISEERVRAAIKTLEAPDPESRSREMDGRRIVPLDEHRAWGWQIVNHPKYRSIRNEEDRREQNRLAQQRYRDRLRNADVSTVSQDEPIQKQKQIQIQKEETEADLPPDFSREAEDRPPVLPDRDLTLFQWFDAIAPVMGAKSRFGLTRQAKWKVVCEICMREGFEPGQLVSAIRRLTTSPKFEMKYFTPEKALDELRVNRATMPLPAKLPTIEEKLADDMLNTSALKPPPRTTAMEVV